MSDDNQRDKSKHEIEALINEAQEKGQTKLDLSNKQLTEIPDALANLTHLRGLYLRGNKLTNIPDTLKQLSSLQWLDLNNNQLTTIPSTLTKLPNLESLDLGNNHISVIPDAFHTVVKIQVLDLSNNQLKSLPHTFAQLTNLQTLDLSGNQFIKWPGVLSNLARLEILDFSRNQLAVIPGGLGQLSSLQILDLSNNQLTSVPETLIHFTNLRWLNLGKNQLKVIPEWLVQLPRLHSLTLYGNPIEVPPPEVVDPKGREPVNLANLRAYFRQLAEAGEDILYEAKLLIVGEPGAGKTTLAHKLRNPNYILNLNESSTQGIDIFTWTFPVSQSVNPDTVVTQNTEAIPRTFRVNIWDFGTQAIYHATHQFFLTRHALYVVVADAREQKANFFHWLDSIEHLSNNSPVIILTNEKQDRMWSINEYQLRSYFTNLTQVFAVNFETNRGLEQLRQAIQFHITYLPHVGDSLPSTWVNVRRILENDRRPTISLDQFLDVCQEYGFSTIEDMLQVSAYLHDLGVCLHFQDHPLLKKIVILKPEWATDAVYRILDNDQVKNNNGQFSQSDLINIWNETHYVSLHDELLALMKKFQLCYEIPNRPGEYIAPQLLDEQHKDYEWPLEDNIYLRYKYGTFMPHGLISRFIVTMHRFIVGLASGEPLVWRTGVVIERDDTKAEIIELTHQREIRIRVTGLQKRDLLTIIVYELDELHSPFHRLNYDKLIPCNCPVCSIADDPHFYRLELLRTRLAHQKNETDCERPPLHAVSIQSLIDNVGIFAGENKEVELQQWIERKFSVDEVDQHLCMPLGVDYENLRGDSRSSKVRELVRYMKRRGDLDKLERLVREQRPK